MRKMNREHQTAWEESVAFWNETFRSEEAEIEEMKGHVLPEEWKSLAPSQKQLDAIRFLSDAKHLLDYGCGNGWASILAAKCGCKNVLAVDVSSNCKAQVEGYAEAFGVSESIRFAAIDGRWLETQPSEAFDGLFSSNVLDVVPEEVTDYILREVHRVLRPGAKAVVSLNNYFPPRDIPERNIEFSEGKYLFMNGILRLQSLKDEEWEQKLAPYFRVAGLEHYAWPGEAKETRRLFYLRRK